MGNARTSTVALLPIAEVVAAGDRLCPLPSRRDDRIPRPVLFPREPLRRPLLLAVDGFSLARRDGHASDRSTCSCRTSGCRHQPHMTPSSARRWMRTATPWTSRSRSRPSTARRSVVAILLLAAHCCFAGLATMAYSVNGLLRPRSVLALRTMESRCGSTAPVAPAVSAVGVDRRGAVRCSR